MAEDRDLLLQQMRNDARKLELEGKEKYRQTIYAQAGANLIGNLLTSTVFVGLLAWLIFGGAAFNILFQIIEVVPMSIVLGVVAIIMIFKFF